MRLRLVVVFAMILLFATVVLAVQLTKDQRTLITTCKYDCREERQLTYGSCITDYRTCSQQCKVDNAICQDNKSSQLALCKNTCLTIEGSSRDKALCSAQCTKVYREERRNECDYTGCKKSCIEEQRTCKAQSQEDYRSCYSVCPFVPFQNVTCDGGYKAGEVYVNECSQCQCTTEGKTTCKNIPNCGFSNFSISKEACENAGGLYQKVCQGPYFRLRCTVDSYCMCAGNFEGSCPLDTLCYTDFTIRLPSDLPGWKGLHGEELGDIGLCAVLPELPNCGDGICQNKICRTCGEPETDLNCQEDCATNLSLV